jgi:hypothetical protein
MLKRNLLLLIALTTLFSACSGPTLLSEKNVPEKIEKYIYSQNKDTICEGESYLKDITFNIRHESGCDLKEMYLLLKIDDFIVYNDKYSSSVPVKLSICKGKKYNKAYSLKVFIIDEKTNMFYHWNRKNAYVLSELSFSTVKITLLSQSDFDEKNGVEFYIDFE